MLFDRARIHVQAGAGGDGCTSFRREAHVPRGGPDGGDGGRGGEVVLVCEGSLRDLQAFRRRTEYRAGRGGHGEGALRHGASGELLIVGVPPGTQISGVDGDMLGRRWDLTSPGQRVLVASGGSGGRGNKRFATSTRRTPRFAERGLLGEQGWLQLRLKLLADVGLVGLPNAGKSSLLARLTRAAPKVADYPFTTLEPVLGVLDDGERQLVLADIPGLIEGASEGAGLGHDFLAHVERTSVLVHVLDLAPQLSAGEDVDLQASYATIERELACHDQRLAGLPRVLALSKADLVGEHRTAQAVAQWSARLGGLVPVIATSSATGRGLAELSRALFRLVGEGSASGGPAQGQPQASAPAAGAGPRAGEHQQLDLAEHILYRPAQLEGFLVERLGEHAFAVRGRGVEQLLARFDVDNEEAMAYLEGRLRHMGVMRALEAQGFQPGDEIQIGGIPFELDPSALA